MACITISTEQELQQAFAIRRKVFVEEQGVQLADEFDEFDTLSSNCQHVLVTYDNQVVGTGRVRHVQGVGKLERICILIDYRKYGLGKTIIRALEKLAYHIPVDAVILHGQTQAEGFYHKLGYMTASEPFLEDGIAHVVMTKTL